MRPQVTIAVLVLGISFFALASKPETLQDLMNRVESVRVEDRPALCVEIAERQLKAANELYTAGKVEEAQTAVRDVVAYSEKGHDAAMESGKKVKNTEIAFRKMAAKLRDIKRSLNFDDQAPVEAAADRLESLRTDLLSHMFGKGK
jgi:hypothetical protein